MLLIRTSLSCAQDTDDGNPLIRALAIRTMGCLRADKILDYISDPLRKCLSDDNPYVRKTAAICVAKLYDLKPSLAIENGFVSHLAQLISDANPMVVANAITALAEIQEVATNAIQASSNPDDSSSPQTSSQQASIFLMDSTILGKLLIALGECTEWGRIAILNAVATHRATDEKEAEHICERVAPQLQHANPSVVLAAIKCIMIHLNLVSRADFSKQMLRKMAPPLGALSCSCRCQNTVLMSVRTQSLSYHLHLKFNGSRFATSLSYFKNSPPFFLPKCASSFANTTTRRMSSTRSSGSWCA